MATQGFKVNFSTYTDPVILVWYLHTNPLAEIDRVSLPFPNVDGEVVSASNLVGATYIFRFFTTLDGTSLDQLIESWSVDVAKGTKTRINRYFYTVNGSGDHDPAAEQNALSDERLADADEVYVWQRGVGFRLPAEFTLDPDGGFSLNGGELFSADDVWMTEAIYKDDIDNVVITGDFSELKIVTEDDTFDSSYYGKQVIADFPADSTGEILFPDFSTIANRRVKFTTYSNAGRYLRLKFASGNTVNYLGESVNQITLRQDEELELFFQDGSCFAIGGGKAELAGEYFFADKKLRGTAYADGTESEIGGWQDLIDRLPAEKICSYTAYDEYVDLLIGDQTKRKYLNRSKFAVDSVGGIFKFPDLRGQTLRALRYTDGTEDETLLSQGSGGRWAEEIISHTHRVPGRASGVVGSGVLADGSDDGQTTTAISESTGGTEQRVDSTAVYPLVRI